MEKQKVPEPKDHFLEWNQSYHPLPTLTEKHTNYSTSYCLICVKQGNHFLDKYELPLKSWYFVLNAEQCSAVWC